MADNNYVSFFETPEYLDSLETEIKIETEEEKRRRLERERLEKIQASSVATTPTDKKEYVSFFETDKYKNSYKDKEPVETTTELDDDISLARKIDYGMAQGSALWGFQKGFAGTKIFYMFGYFWF